MMSLTRRQQDLLRYLAGHIEARGYAPSYYDMSLDLGIASKGPVSRLLSSLEGRGAITRQRNRARAVAPTAPVTIPRAPDGAPLFFVKIGGTD